MHTRRRFLFAGATGLGILAALRSVGRGTPFGRAFAAPPAGPASGNAGVGSPVPGNPSPGRPVPGNPAPGGATAGGPAMSAGVSAGAPAFPVTHTDAQWRRLLTPAQYEVLREAGTERPYSSPLNDEHRRGRFACAGCALPLFSSDTKFDSHTGWPSFWAPLDHAVGTEADVSFGMVRTAVHCSRCGGHLGHVFDDGPRPTGLRYCMNGLALVFHPAAA